MRAYLVGVLRGSGEYLGVSTLIWMEEHGGVRRVEGDQFDPPHSSNGDTRVSP